MIPVPFILIVLLALGACTASPPMPAVAIDPALPDIRPLTADQRDMLDG